MLRKIFIFFAVVISELCFGAFFVVIFVNTTHVACALEPDDTYACQIQTLLLGRIPTFKRTVDNVVDIVMERDDCDEGCSYRAEFVTTDGRQVPLSEVWTDQGPVQQQVSAISSQMGRRVNPLIYDAQPAWWVLWLVGGLTLMGLLLSPLVFLGNRR
jgi:hypothetical protein